MAEEFIPQYEQLNPQLRDKIDWPYEVNYAILTIMGMKKDYERFDSDILNDMIDLFENLIPAVYRDEQYTKEIKSHQEKILIDNRPSWCGQKMQSELYKNLTGQEPFSFEEKIKPAKKFGAIINLLHRLNALNKIEYTEKFTGEEWKEYIERTSEAEKP